MYKKQLEAEVKEYYETLRAILTMVMGKLMRKKNERSSWSSLCSRRKDCDLGSL